MKLSLDSITKPMDRWLCRPEPNAAGRLGLYRIAYSLFYLWNLHDYIPGNLLDVPIEFRSSLLVNRWLPENLSPMFFDALAAALVGGLVLLLLGYWTRTATAWVLVTGLLFESLFGNVDLERSTVFIAAFIPFFMLVFGDWGATYSIDAVLRWRAGGEAVDPRDNSPRFVLPIHALLVVLAALFVDAGILKVMHFQTGFGQDHFMGHLILRARIYAAVDGISLMPFAEKVYEHPLLDSALGLTAIGFELTFFLALINLRLRAFYVATALIFHSVNAIWLHVTFTSLMVVYGLFIDWEAMFSPVNRKVTWPRQIPSAVLRAGAIILASAIAFLWIQTDYVQRLISAGGLIDGRTIWIPVLPLAVVWWLRAVWKLLR